MVVVQPQARVETQINKRIVSPLSIPLLFSGISQLARGGYGVNLVAPGPLKSNPLIQYYPTNTAQLIKFYNYKILIPLLYGSDKRQGLGHLNLSWCFYV